MYSVKAFLSVLAVANAEDLNYVQSKLAPHRLVFHRSSFTLPIYETLQTTQDESPFCLDTAEDAQPSGAVPAIGGRQSHPTRSAPASPETAYSCDLFAQYTTLDDLPSSHEQTAIVDTGMLDCKDTTIVPTASCSTPHSPTLPRSENASDILTTAADSNEPTNAIMNDVAEITPPP
jgi:hypothetical protein